MMEDQKSNSPTSTKARSSRRSLVHGPQSNTLNNSAISPSDLEMD
jgi:hypothetical protein